MLGLGSVTISAPGNPPRTVRNQRQNGYAKVCVRLLGFGDVRYKLSAIYVEFENVASPGDAVVNPSFDKDAGIEYYSALSGSGTRDFLRVPLTGVAGSLSAGFAGADENTVTFTAVTASAAGVHGVTFSSAANSKICGVALVAAPVWADRSQDVVFGRAYYEAADQLLKPAAGQVAVTYTEEFTEVS